ncbi:helix-turn-helix domain-containing protein [Verrucomicrobiota bacterium]
MQAENSQKIMMQEMPMYDVGMRKNSIPRHGTGARITELRIQAGLSQKDLAERIDVPIANIGFWERTNTPPSSKVLPELAKALDTTVEFILLGKEKTNRKRSGGPTGKTKEVFEEVSSLPRRQQKKIIDVVDALIVQAKVAQ